MSQRMRLSRADRSLLSEWWFTVDHALVCAILAIVSAGIVLSLAAGPVVAASKGFPPYHFVERHIVFSLLGLAVMMGVSLLSPRGVRRLALVLLLAAFAGLVVVYWYGTEINGARRWLFLFGHSFQPSEVAKPAFVVVSAWLFAETHTHAEMPALPLSVLLAITFLGLLVVQPDVGQTILAGTIWATLYFVSGQPLIGGLVIIVLGFAGLAATYVMFPHVQIRIDRFINPGQGDNSQLDRAIQSFTEGGFFGRGPGEGTIKAVLPDAHTDFIFAVAAEEYGVVTCLLLLGLFAFVVFRAIYRVWRDPDASIRLAVIGLALLFGLQAMTNIGVNVGLLPVKGMTLPFLSSGGSSILAMSVLLGMLLSLTRRRSDIERVDTPRPAPIVESAGLSGRSAAR